ncbi:MAG: hypothetical protein MUC82_15745 [Cypionkella sp.]|nr:hypothetical protein [Cypionkella sp.]
MDDKSAVPVVRPGARGAHGAKRMLDQPALLFRTQADIVVIARGDRDAGVERGKVVGRLGGDRA